MNKLIIIKYGELSTKKDNINFFIKTLNKNIMKVIDKEAIIKYDKGRMFIFPNQNNEERIIKDLQKVFGIHQIVVGYQDINKDLTTVCEHLINELSNREFTTFKVETKRSDKSYSLTSLEISKEVGHQILENIPNLKVDVRKPVLTINIEIRAEGIYYYFASQKGLGGYPVGTLGKGLLMLSGGIDSPVAGYLTMKRGVKLEAIYFESPPHTSVEAKNKVISLAKELAKYNLDMKIHIINFTKIQETIYQTIPHDYLITIMRRMMYRISEQVAMYNKCKILVNGESIGQVASQTLTSMNAINRVVHLPVIRPLACFDKQEIIAIAQNIDTFRTSILPYEDCCTIFVPKHPVINPELSKCLEYEALFDYESLIKEAIQTKEIVKVSTIEEKYNNIL